VGGGGRRGFLRRSGGIEKYLEGFERDDGFKWLAGMGNRVLFKSINIDFVRFFF